MTFSLRTPLIGTAAIALLACGNSDAETARIDDDGSPMAMMSGEYTLYRADGRSPGSVVIQDTASGVDVTLALAEISPGQHAVHFHETGSCETPDFKSAGGHYNPSDVNHGFESAAPNPHAGDMPNITVPDDGVVNVTVENTRVSLSVRDGFAPLYDANGSALIIHAGADDYESQPSGAAGGRIACAVISAASDNPD